MADQQEYDQDTDPQAEPGRTDFDSPERPYSDFDYTQGAYREGYSGERMRRRAHFPGEYDETPGRKYDYDYGYGNRYRREYMRGQRDASPQYGPGDEMPRRHRRPRRRGRFNWRREGPSGEGVSMGRAFYDQEPFEGRFPRGPHSGKGPAGYQRSNRRILEDVCERLTGHGWVDAGEIEVETENGVVTLRGQVDDYRQKRMAEDSAISVSGVRDVQNRLTVRDRGAKAEEEA